MNPIRLPLAAVRLAATPEAELVQLKQTADGTVLTVAAGPRVLRLWATPSIPPDKVEPFTIKAVDLVKAAHAVGLAGTGTANELPLVVVQLSPAVAGIAGPFGTPQTVSIVTTSMPDFAGPIDRVEGERASGMTRAVAVVDARHLSELAEVACGMSCTAITFTFAPRFASVLAEMEAEGQAATFVIASGITAADAKSSPQSAADHALVFTMPETTARRSTRRRPPTPTEYREEDLPF